MKPKIYLLPGLAADRRLYQSYEFEGYQSEVIEWIEPLKKESFDDYILRFSEVIDGTQPFVLVGTSLGGIVAGHIAQRVKPQLIVLISSIKHIGELPARWKALKYFPVHKITPVPLVKAIIQGYRKVAGKSAAKQAKLLHEMVDSVSPRFIRWAANQTVNYDRKELKDVSYVHIHGDRDRIFPLRFITEKPRVIERGDHFMVINHSKEINKIIINEIEKLTVKE